jgi:glutathione S-transferase
MLTLITTNRNYSSWSLRAWLLLKVLGVPFEDRVEPAVLRDNWAPFRAFSPTGRVPVLLHEGRTVWDSLAILLYLAERHDGLWPAQADARAFAMSAVAEMHGGFSAIRNQCGMSVGVRVAMRQQSPALQADVARLSEIFAEGLTRFGGPYLAGDRFTAIDAFFAPVAFRARTYGLDLGKGQAWVEHILHHPHLREWEAMALAETGREIGHEEEVAAAGEIVADYRAH